MANSDSGTVSVIPTATYTVTATIGVGEQPANVAVNPSGIYAYVTNVGSNSVSVISLALLPAIVSGSDATATNSYSAQDVTLSATVTSPNGTVDAGTVTFTVTRNGATVEVGS